MEFHGSVVGVETDVARSEIPEKGRYVCVRVHAVIRTQPAIANALTNIVPTRNEDPFTPEAS
jgi:hypothetical protein